MAKLAKCEDVNELLVLYHYGELTPVKAALVEEHMAGCDECRAELEALRRAVGLIRPDTPSAAEAGRVVSGVMRRIGARTLSPLLRLTPAVAAAALVVIVTLVFNYTGPLTFSGEPFRDKPGVQVLLVTANLDLLENYDVVSELDVLEQMDTLETMEEL